MKIALASWTSKNKTAIFIVLFILAVIMIIVLIFQSMQKDHTYETALMKIQLKEEYNKNEQQLRADYNALIQQKIIDKRIFEVSDSVTKSNTYILDKTLRELLLQKTDHEKYKAIDNLGSDELRNYYSNLPKHNDY